MRSLIEHRVVQGHRCGSHAKGSPQHRRQGRGVGLTAMSLAAVVGFSAVPAYAATASLSGTVVCGGGAPVTGIYVTADGGGSGWAAWSPMPGAPHVAALPAICVDA
jgi:hypothetical protein